MGYQNTFLVPVAASEPEIIIGHRVHETVIMSTIYQVICCRYKVPLSSHRYRFDCFIDDGVTLGRIIEVNVMSRVRDDVDN